MLTKWFVAAGVAAALIAWSGSAGAHPNSHGGCTHTVSSGINHVDGNSNDNVCFAVDGEPSQSHLGAGADKLYGYASVENARGERGHDQIFGLGGGDALYDGYGQDDLAGDRGDDNIYADMPGNNERTCDGPGNDYIDIEDGEGSDTWYNDPDGVPERLILRDAGDRIVDNASCPF